MMLAGILTAGSALKNLVDYRISVIRYAPTNLGRADYITSLLAISSEGIGVAETLMYMRFSKRNWMAASRLF
jgi:hypothetical protein